MAPPAKPPVAILPALTGLRGVAAVWVVLFHVQTCAGVLGIPMALRTPIVAHGWLAVDLFFVLSGFVLMHAYGCDFRTFDAAALRRYAVQRFLRVYPTATAVLLMILVLTCLDPAFVADWRDGYPDDFTLASFVRTLTLSTRWFPPLGGDWNQPVWSLSVELIGYLALPLVAHVLIKIETWTTAMIIGFGCIGALTCLNLMGGRTDFNDIGFFGITRMAYCLVGGAALAQAWAHAPAAAVRYAGPAAFVAVAAVGLACAKPVFMPIALTAMATLIFALAVGGGVLGALLSIRPILWLGRISFPLYLVHRVPLLCLTDHIRVTAPSGATVGLLLCAYVVACGVAAYGLHLTIERPAQRLARRLTKPTCETNLIAVPAH